MKKIILTLGLVSLLASCHNGSGGAGSSSDNPLFVESNLELGAPMFDKIKPEHFVPAFEEGMKQHLQEIDSIVNNPEAPTFENTIVAMQRAGGLLSRVEGVFSPLVSALGTEDIRKIEDEIRPQLTAHYDAIMLNDKLFARVKAVYDTEKGKLEGEDARLLDKVYQDFTKSGADLPAESKEELKKVNTELATLQNQFSKLVVDATAAAAVVVDQESELEGLTPDAIAQAKQDAEEAGHKGKYLLTISNTTREAALASLKNRDLRKRLLEASLLRGERGDKNDTQELVRQIVLLRAKKAQIMGQPNYASWVLQDQMAGNPEAVYQLIGQLAKPLALKEKSEAKELETFAQKTEGKDFKLEAWDWDYYANQLRKEKYDLNEQEIRPYFPLDSVLKNGVFYMAKELYGLSFVERPDLPTYHTDVKAYEVKDDTGKTIALYYTDFYRRPTKQGGAWMGNFQQQSKLLGKLPIVYNVCNFPAPVDGQPTLLNMDEVETLFHEFGHALHGMFADTKYAYLSGTSVPRDFVEMPSQFDEHWVLEPKILAHYARHYQTNQPIPQSLIDKIKASDHFNQAYPLGENLGAVIIDMAWHMLAPEAKIGDIATFEREALEKFGMYNTQIPPRYRSPYFRHSMMGDYSAGYYAYLWSEVLDLNIYSWFLRNGGMSRANGDRFRKIILSQGNSQDLNKIFKEFTGLDHPDTNDLMRAKGLL